MEQQTARDNLSGKKRDESPRRPGESQASDLFKGLSFKVGVAENKNVTYRSKMEDVHTYIANFAERVDWGYFAIFDGHAGKDTARWCGNNLHTLIANEINEEEDGPEHNYNYDMKEKLHDAFIKADKLIENEGTGSSGSTAAVAVLRWELKDATGEPTAYSAGEDGKSQFDFIPSKDHKRILYTSNVGDLRILLCREGHPYRLSYDHKATDDNEVNRIRETGGLVMKNRVNGVLAVTRSLGDTYMKDLVVGRPFTTSTEITPKDEFMILACDGLWDVVPDQKACQYVSELFKTNSDPQDAAKKLCQLAMDNSTTDNVTVMIVKFDKRVFDI
ncbi:uncharacterized protein PRCAT00000116001 [Priceomyces carsonii]|uniref:uncharacterized protein n=1 Tax=Priceomyces carsonii TaxID=28549 RepID=UPI002EDAC66A|nr:unnamed protein product [Priceomyces carsonii]